MHITSSFVHLSLFIIYNDYIPNFAADNNSFSAVRAVLVRTEAGSNKAAYTSLVLGGSEQGVLVGNALAGVGGDNNNRYGQGGDWSY